MREIDVLDTLYQCQTLAAGAEYYGRNFGGKEAEAFLPAALGVVSFALGIVMDYLDEKYSGKMI